MSIPVQDINVIQMNRIPIGRLVSLSRKMRRDLELIVVKQTPFGAGILREFIIDKIKAPLLTLLIHTGDKQMGLKGLVVLLKLARNFYKLPEPTKENTWHPNSHALIKLRDEFFRHEVNTSRHSAFRAVWKFVIILYDSDWYYRERIDWVMGYFHKMSWETYEGEEKPREPWWKE